MDVTSTDVKSVIEKLFFRGGQPASVALDADLLATGVCDSMGLVTLAAKLEERFGIRIKDQEITRINLGSVKRIIRFLSAKGVQVRE
jgi:acyl carrier protein